MASLVYLILLLFSCTRLVSPQQTNSTPIDPDDPQEKEDDGPGQLDEYFDRDDLTEDQLAQLQVATDEFRGKLVEQLKEGQAVLGDLKAGGYETPQEYTVAQGKYRLHWFANYSLMGNPFAICQIFFILIPFLIGKLLKIVGVWALGYKKESEHAYDEFYVPKLMDLQQTRAEMDVYVEERNTIIWASRKMKIEPHHVENELDAKRKPKPRKFLRYRRSHWMFLRSMLKTFGAARMAQMIREAEDEAEAAGDSRQKIGGN